MWGAPARRPSLQPCAGCALCSGATLSDEPSHCLPPTGSRGTKGLADVPASSSAQGLLPRGGLVSTRRTERWPFGKVGHVPSVL